MVLLIDNYDSFTYNLYDYIVQAGEQCLVLRNDEMSLAQIAALDFSSAVISPGPKTPASAGVTLPFIEKFYTTKPILGICLGHQAIGQFFGANLGKGLRPMHGKTSLISLKPHFLFQGLPAAIEVMRYHSLTLQALPTADLQVIATTAEGEIMAIAHKKFLVAGLQFHPESVLTPSGLPILRNWFAKISTVKIAQ